MRLAEGSKLEVHCRDTTIQLAVHQKTTFAALKKDIAERFHIPPSEQILCLAVINLFEEPSFLSSSRDQRLLEEEDLYEGKLVSAGIVYKSSLPGASLYVYEKLTNGDTINVICGGEICQVRLSKGF